MEASAETPQNEGAESQVQDGGNVETASEGTPDISEQLAAINTRLESLAPQQEQQTEIGDQDLLNFLTAEDGSEGDYGYADEAVQGDEQPNEDDEALAAFNDAVRERVAESVEPYIEALEMQRRETAIGQLQQEFPQLKDPATVQAIKGQLQYAAQQYQNPALASDPHLVRMALLAHLGQAAAKNEVPAEQARSQGASIETGTGAGADGQPSEEDQIKAAILGAATGGGYFG